MVILKGPNPDPPQEGEIFIITAKDGVAPFKFKWKVAKETWKEVKQQNLTLRIKIPDDTMGEALAIEVTDEMGTNDMYNRIING